MVCGSATPRPESWHGIAAGPRCPRGWGGGCPPSQVVDLRRDSGYPFTRPLLDALGAIEDGGGRAILLQTGGAPRQRFTAAPADTHGVARAATLR